MSSTRHKNKIEKGIDKIGSNIQENLLLQDEREEWPQEKFKKLLQAFEKSEQIASEIPISIIRHDKNIRRKIDDLNIDSLARDIERDGLIHPPTITLEKNEKGYYFLMTAGHRRLLAYKKIGRRRIPVTIRLYKTESDRLIASFTENNSRQNMDVFDLASSFEILRNSGLSFNDISEKTGFDKTTVTRYIRFDKWSNNLVKLVRDNSANLPLRFLTSLLSKEKFDDESRFTEITKSLDQKKKEIGPSGSLPGTKKEEKKAPHRRQGAEARVIEAINVRELDTEQLKLISTILLEARIIKKPLIGDARVHRSS